MNKNEYTWNNAVILDKIHSVLDTQNIDDIQLTDELLNEIKSKLDNSISTDDITNSVFILAKNIAELKSLPDEDIKVYIARLQSYLNSTSFKYIIAEFNGIEFEINKQDSIEDIFSNYYSKYDVTYGISDMLFDLGLK